MLSLSFGRSSACSNSGLMVWYDILDSAIVQAGCRYYGKAKKLRGHLKGEV
jgi:hypothetical protein